MSWITLRLSKIHLEKLKELVELGYYPNKTEAVRMAIRDLLAFHFRHKRRKKHQDYNFVVEYYVNGTRRTKGYNRLGNAMEFARKVSKNSYAIILWKDGELLMEFANEKKLKEM